MLQHVLIGAAVPALIPVALRGPLVFFFLPAPILGRLAHLAPLRALASFLLRPRPSLGVLAAVIAAWHVPAGARGGSGGWRKRKTRTSPGS